MEITTLVLADEAEAQAVSMRIHNHARASEILAHCAQRLRELSVLRAPAVVIDEHREQAQKILELQELVNDYAATLGARVKVENEMWQTLADKRPMPDLDDIKDWALRLGVPATLIERFNKKRTDQ